MDKIKLGFVPTRRSIFSAPDAIKYRGLTADRLREIGVDIVDIDDINDEGLLFDDSHIEPIVKKFRAEGVDGIMLCHANFGTEYVCARLARELGLPVLSGAAATITSLPAPAFWLAAALQSLTKASRAPAGQLEGAAACAPRERRLRVAATARVEVKRIMGCSFGSRTNGDSQWL